MGHSSSTPETPPPVVTPTAVPPFPILPSIPVPAAPLPLVKCDTAAPQPRPLSAVRAPFVLKMASSDSLPALISSAPVASSTTTQRADAARHAAKLALACAYHPRLGAHSLATILTPDVIDYITALAFGVPPPDWWFPAPSLIVGLSGFGCGIAFHDFVLGKPELQSSRKSTAPAETEEIVQHSPISIDSCKWNLVAAPRKASSLNLTTMRKIRFASDYERCFSVMLGTSAGHNFLSAFDLHKMKQSYCCPSSGVINEWRIGEAASKRGVLPAIGKIRNYRISCGSIDHLCNAFSPKLLAVGSKLQNTVYVVEPKPAHVKARKKMDIGVLCMMVHTPESQIQVTAMHGMPQSPTLLTACSDCSIRAWSSTRQVNNIPLWSTCITSEVPVTAMCYLQESEVISDEAFAACAGGRCFIYDKRANVNSPLITMDLACRKAKSILPLAQNTVAIAVATRQGNEGGVLLFDIRAPDAPVAILKTGALTSMNLFGTLGAPFF
ncbi:hypothetical protein Pelo_5670 [Pelomyxa schiedti]|nr:hypothetical protein Pelo_5670 [Pelomyxa schiedti]